MSSREEEIIKKLFELEDIPKKMPLIKYTGNVIRDIMAKRCFCLDLFVNKKI